MFLDQTFILIFYSISIYLYLETALIVILQTIIVHMEVITEVYS